MDFGDALKALKDGKGVARANWAGAYLILVTGEGEPPVGNSVSYAASVSKSKELSGWIGVFTNSETFVPWSAQHQDILASDWHLIL